MFWFSSKDFLADQALALATIIISNQIQFENHLLRALRLGATNQNQSRAAPATSGAHRRGLKTGTPTNQQASETICATFANSSPL